MDINLLPHKRYNLQEIEEEKSHWMQEEFISELTAMWRYLEFTFAVPKNIYEIAYLGQKKDLHQQLLCHAMHEMRHAEMLARVMSKWGNLPQWQISPLPAFRTYRGYLDGAMADEARNLESYQLRQTEVKDNELKLLITNILREDAVHLQTDQAAQEVLTAQGVIDKPLVQPGGKAEFTDDISLLEKAADLEIKSITRLIYGSLLLGADQSIAPRIRALAIEDMQHLHRIAQEVIIIGGRLVIQQNSLMLEPNLALNDLLSEAVCLKGDKVKLYKEAKRQFQAPGGGILLGDLVAKEEENIVDLEAYLQSLEQYPLIVH